MFRVTGETPWDELEQQIREVPLQLPRDGELVYPYESARITLESIPYVAVRPTSLYVVRSNLARQRRLTADLSAQGYDPLRLAGALTVQDDDLTPLGLLPPIVEETPTDGRYILDGNHRTFLGWRGARLTFAAIRISDIRKDCPAAVFPNGWDEIVEYDETPVDPAMKRHYRDNPDYYRRSFTRLNGSRPRN